MIGNGILDVHLILVKRDGWRYKDGDGDGYISEYGERRI